MDDWSLEKLSAKPAKLSPAFNTKVFEYTSQVSSAVEKVNIDCLTSDTGASYQIKGNKGSKTVELPEGKVTEIDVEVTSDDGTVGHYIIKVKRLSSKDASLEGLTVDKGKLSPAFDSARDEYWVTVGIVDVDILVTPKAPDAKCQLTVCGSAPGEKTTLNVGETLVEVVVGSIDGSMTKAYKLYVTRPPVPRYMKITDPKLRVKFEDPFSLSPYYLPISVRESDPKHTFSGAFITEITRTNKSDPLSQLALPADWSVRDYTIDKELSAAVAQIPLSYGGTIGDTVVRDIPAKLTEANITPKEVAIGAECKSETLTNHSYELRAWEKDLQRIFDESNATKLTNASKDHVKKYLSALPKTPGANKSWPDGESPSDHITNAAYCLACAIKSKKTDANAHLQLGLVLEERYRAEDVYDIKNETGGPSERATLNMQVKAGSKEEEIQAICKIHGVDERAPLSLVLKTLDTEYQAMKNAGNTAKADQCYALFAWKNKQATQEGAAAQKASDDTNPLGQAYLKYLDALSCDESKSVYHFHVGRLQVIQGQYDDAVIRLQSALSWNKSHQMSRFYLGLALSLRKSGPGTRATEAFGYIQEAMELLLTKQTNLSLGVDKSESSMLVDDLLRLTNVHILRGIISLGNMVHSNPEFSKGCMSAEDLYHTAVLLATFALPTVSRGDLYKQIEWIILDGHKLLLDMLLAKGDNPEYISKRCEGLSALVRSTTIEHNQQLATLQQKTSEALVSIQPCSSQALYLLGNSQLALYDLDPTADNAAVLLDSCKNSLKASIDMEGKSTHSDLPANLTEQAWWKAKSEAAAKPAESKAAAPAAKSIPGGRGGAAAGRGAPAVRGAAATKTPSKGAQAKPAARGAPAAAKGAPAGRGGAAARGAPAARGGAKAPAAAAPSKTDSKPETAAPAAAGVTKAASSPQTQLPAVLNRKSHHARLSLARAYNRTEDGAKDAETYYNEVMVMSPEVHDAYIELADMLAKTDPLAAVEIYCKFPIPENPGFDDAYIFGEIVLILFKFEKYDHPHLADNMIRLGQIMGIAYLDKYVKKLEEKFRNTLLKQVYAGVNRKSVDDPDMVQFFKFKYWD